MIKNYETNYYGISVQQYNGEFHLQSANGCEDYAGKSYPSDEQINAFARLCRK